LHAKQVWEKLGISEVINEATALDRTGDIATALEHIICTKGGWRPLGGIGLPKNCVNGCVVYLMGKKTKSPWEKCPAPTSLDNGDWSPSGELLESTEESS
jgi:hypothetical protein